MYNVNINPHLSSACFGPGTGLRALGKSAGGIFKRTLWSKYSYYPHLTDKERGTERLSDLPYGHRAGIKSQLVFLITLHTTSIRRSFPALCGTGKNWGVHTTGMPVCPTLLWNTMQSGKSRRQMCLFCMKWWSQQIVGWKELQKSIRIL